MLCELGTRFHLEIRLFHVYGGKSRAAEPGTRQASCSASSAHLGGDALALQKAVNPYLLQEKLVLPWFLNVVIVGIHLLFLEAAIFWAASISFHLLTLPPQPGPDSQFVVGTIQAPAAPSILRLGLPSSLKGSIMLCPAMHLRKCPLGSNCGSCYDAQITSCSL